MKTYFILLVGLITSISIAQNNQIVKTEEGRSVLLKADFTWEYIDAEQDIAITSKSKSTNCNLTEDFVEPDLDKKIQSQLKKGRATMPQVKKKIAKEYNCEPNDIILISVSEIKAKAQYRFCVKGKEVTYKRIGNSIIKKEKFF